ncbi:hypothetical protein [Streptomyces celluloflavus]|uniref:hypothetical protein n=1 Tax=Streptomyces celluloflavus TaxID=58344 RepID=UPI00369C6E12
MSVQIVRFRTEPERVPEVEEAVRRLFAAVRDAAPEGIEYGAARVGDGAEFLLTLRIPEGAPNPLLAIPEAGAFRARVAEWAGAPVPPATLHMIGRYTG